MYFSRLDILWIYSSRSDTLQRAYCGRAPLQVGGIKTLPKAQRTRGLSSSYLSNFLRSYHEFKHKSWSNFIFRISTKHELQNFNQTSASQLNLKFTILSRISTKIQLHNLYKTSATKCWTSSSFKILLNFNFKILTNPCAQSLKKV